MVQEKQELAKPKVIKRDFSQNLENEKNENCRHFEPENKLEFSFTSEASEKLQEIDRELLKWVQDEKIQIDQNDYISLVLVQALASTYSKACSSSSTSNNNSFLEKQLKKIDKKLFEFLISQINLSQSQTEPEPTNIVTISNIFIEVFKNPTMFIGSSSESKNIFLDKNGGNSIFYFMNFVKTMAIQMQLANKEMETTCNVVDQATKGGRNLKSFLELKTMIEKTLDLMAISILTDQGTPFS